MKRAVIRHTLNKIWSLTHSKTFNVFHAPSFVNLNGKVFHLRLHSTWQSNNGNGSDSGSFTGKKAKKVKEILKAWLDMFHSCHISEPKQSIEHIIAHTLGSRSISSVYKFNNKVLSLREIQQINELCQQRLKRLPIQYIIQEWDFRGLTLKMSPPVFIPRPETEMLVDVVLNEVERKATDSVLEFCCGSGAISISLLKSQPQLNVTAIDKSKEACGLTELNAKLHDVSSRLKVIHEEITEDHPDAILKKYDVIVSNPPYLFEDDMISLQPEIKLYEDLEALDGGIDGLKVIKNILRVSSGLLNCDGRVFLEVDPRHPDLIRSWLRQYPAMKLHLERVYKDFCDKDRFVEIVKK
ncbi:hypothetical protein PPYR_06812 [Photinus pyralis]|uniref:peptide chain release factor N(5)-glutamine methyltransferase n=2 Tax=Photinus pyralis TaxID=7054 RepID=A0A1Y1LVY7_PHOPY|nr:MTRF1L release factor glutamine methyltransferase [Photinus pyralis]KAB0798932.1 hypothetical protein PPYR_06812 [Photinus pyralis]